jgi:predicted NBD/HSP70 family sugar kinase
MTRLGIDIGGTKTHGVAVDDDGGVLAEVRLPTGFGAEQVVGTAVAAAEQLAERAGVGISEVDSVGVGVPGPVDHESGWVGHAVNLGLDGLDLGAVLRRRLQVAVRVDNDVNAAALGTYRTLAEPVASMAYLNLGTGLAAGLVLDGRLWRGSGGVAGEIGHIPVEPEGDLCPCGQRGCIETIASGVGIAARWPTDARHPVAALFEAAARGSPSALELKGRFVSGVASAVRVLVLSTGVDVVVVGGGISSLGEPLMADVAATLDAWADRSPFLAAVELSRRLRLACDRGITAAIGAALIAFEG